MWNRLLPLVVCWLPGPAAFAQDQAPRAAVELVFTGGSGGFGNSAFRYELQDRLEPIARHAGLDLSADRVLHGVFHQGRSAVWAVDGTVQGGIDFLNGGDVSCDPMPESYGYRTPTEWLLPMGQEPGSPFHDVPDAEVSSIEWYRCRAGQAEAWWVRPRGDDEPYWSLPAFDIRSAISLVAVGEGKEYRAFLLGMPRQESSRLVRAVQDTLEARPGAVFLDAGDFLPGPSLLTPDTVSPYRQTALEALQAMDPVVLVPGVTELASGPQAFLDEARRYQLPYVATNWRSQDTERTLPPVLRATLGTPGAPVDVAFLGAIDPAAVRVDIAVREGGVQIVDPVRAVQETVDVLLENDPPDLIVLVTQAGPELLAAFRTELHGVDLLIGDTTGATFRVDNSRVNLRPITRSETAAPLTMPMDGVSLVRVTLGSGGVESVAMQTVPVRADDVADLAMTAAITTIRAPGYAAYDRVLVPADPSANLQGVGTQTLEALLCQAVLDETDADIVMLPAVQDISGMPGPLTELRVGQALAVMDPLEAHRVDGDKVIAMLVEAEDEVQVICGAQVGTVRPKVGGRSTSTLRTYRVVTTQRARLGSGLGPILDRARGSLAFEKPKFTALVNDEGQPLLLAAVGLRRLRAWRDAAAGDAWVAQVAGRTPDDPVPIWLWDLDRISLKAEGFQVNAHSAAYSEVSETLINSPSSFTLGGEADTTVLFDGSSVDWDARFNATYTRLAINGDAPRETADDWRLSTSLSLPGLGFPVGASPRLQPYGELLMDSEFTPIVDAGGATLPLQSDLSLTIGLSATRWRWLSQLRLGFFVNQDLGRLDKGLEYGVRSDVRTSHDIARALRLTTEGYAYFFGSTPKDDGSDLRFKAFGDVRLQVRVVRWLYLALYGKGFLAQGRVPETSDLAASFTGGVALDLSAAWRIDRGRIR